MEGITVSFACDGLLIGIILFTVICGWSRGFIKSFMGLVKGIASAIAAYAYTPLLSNWLNENHILKPITDGIFETLKGLAFDTATDLYNLDRLAADLPAPLVSILERYNVSIPDFATGMPGLTGVSEEVVYDCSVAIATPTAALLSAALAFAAIFIGVFAVLSFLTGLLDMIFHLPVLNAANKALGFLFGAVEAFFLVSVMSILLSALVTSLGSIEPNLFGAEVIDHTILCKFFIEHNPLDRIYDVLGSF